MAKISWDQVGQRFYETGLDRGVLYIGENSGVPWNGLVFVNERPSGGGSTGYYIDGYKYQNVPESKEFFATIEAFTYPDEFAQCDGLQHVERGLFLDDQIQTPFGLSYRTRIGNDLDGIEHGYKLHLIYNALAKPSNRRYSSMDDNPEAIRFSWDISTSPISIDDRKPTSHLIIDSRKATPLLLEALEGILYGTEEDDSRLPPPSEIITLFTEWPDFQVIDNGDGTYTVIGSNDAIQFVSETEFQLSGDSVIDNGDGTFTISSA